MAQINQLDFSGSIIYCGIDVHKKNWRVNIQSEEFELEDFSQDANPVTLYRHLIRRYPGATYRMCYEAGFSGFSSARWLNSQASAECLVVHPADVSTTDKEKRQKNDKSDARKLCWQIQGKQVKSVHIPDPHWEHARSLTRMRDRLVSNQTRCKNRIWQFLYFHGLSLGEQMSADQYWSKQMVCRLQSLDCGSEELKASLGIYIKDFLQTRSLLLEATKMVRKACVNPLYASDIALLRSIPGVGPIIAAILLFEIQDINRFKGTDKLKSYVGLVPDTSDSGDKKSSKGITKRRNNFLRTALVEASWTVIRKDPAMLMLYKDYCKRMEKNKAIIRIAKHLLARIYFVLKNKEPYIVGLVR